MVTEFRKRRDYIVEALNSMKGIICQNPDGAFYVFPNIRAFGRTSKEIARYLLEEGGVALLDGTSFGAWGEGYLRLSYAASMDVLKEGISRIRTALCL